jgi:hypothetical protein
MKQPLTAARVHALRDEYTRTLEPVRALAVETLTLERTLSGNTPAGPHVDYVRPRMQPFQRPQRRPIFYTSLLSGCRRLHLCQRQLISGGFL